MRTFRFFNWKRRRERHNFVFGERSLRAYLAGGNVRFLDDAEKSLDLVDPSSVDYRNARLYLGVAKTQLRKSSESIRILEELRKASSSDLKAADESSFDHNVALNLAFAHIKTYKEEGFDRAGKILDDLVAEAQSSHGGVLLLASRALQAFLFSVMAGYSERKWMLSSYVSKALSYGEYVLGSSESSAAMRFEALNAIGIAWMRFSQHSASSELRNRSERTEWREIGDRAEGWIKAESNFKHALEIVPHSVRALQNMATLRLIQVRVGDASDPDTLLSEAKDYISQSLAINDQDQFPYCQMAEIAIKQNQASIALKYIREGRTKFGEVKTEVWARLQAEAEAL